MVVKEYNKKPGNDDLQYMVKSVLIYGAETSSLYEDDRRRINPYPANVEKMVSS
jgi:hypothetical protein